MRIFLVVVQVIQSQEGDFRLYGLGGFGSAQLLIRRVSETLGLFFFYKKTKDKKRNFLISFRHICDQSDFSYLLF